MKQGQEAANASVLFANHQVHKIIASFPVPRSPSMVSEFQKAFQRGDVELEVVPQGTIAERIRTGGAGLPAFHTPTSVGTRLAEGKETREFNGRPYVLEHALTDDYAFVRARTADATGNLVYRSSSGNFNPIMAMAAKVAIAEVTELVEAGGLDPEAVVTPGIFVGRVVKRP